MSNEFSLSVVKPITVTESMILSTDVAEDDYATWAVGTTYALADRVIYQHKIYESLKASNVGNNPATDATSWIEVSSTNRYKLFDLSNSSQTAKANSFTYTIKPNQAVTTLAILNLTGVLDLHVTMEDDVYGVVFDNEYDLAPTQATADWWDWAFGLRVAPSLSTVEDLPTYPAAELTITITGTAELAVGVLLLGVARRFGLGVKYGAQVGTLDYSRKERNEWGDLVLEKRNYARRANFDMTLDRIEVDAVYDLLTSLQSTPTLWVGSKEYRCTVVYGFCKEFNVLIPYPQHADCSIELEGMT